MLEFSLKMNHDALEFSVTRYRAIYALQILVKSTKYFTPFLFTKGSGQTSAAN